MAGPATWAARPRRPPWLRLWAAGAPMAHARAYHTGAWQLAATPGGGRLPVATRGAGTGVWPWYSTLYCQAAGAAGLYR